MQIRRVNSLTAVKSAEFNKIAEKERKPASQGFLKTCPGSNDIL